jgi:hypothetical protein
MGAQLNIKSEDAYRLASRLVGLTGESLTRVVTKDLLQNKCAKCAVATPPSSWPAKHAPAKARRRPGAGHPRLSFFLVPKTWMAGPSPAMTMCDEPCQLRFTYFPTSPPGGAGAAGAAT